MSIDSLLFRARAVRPQASFARPGASRSGIPSRALCSVVFAMPPKRGDQSPGATGRWRGAAGRM
eukprot:15264807-Alexandrium_andersonii.AAC.1